MYSDLRTLLVGAMVTATIPTSILAQSVCDVALTERAFNLESSSIIDNLASAKRSSLCDKDYNSEQEARSDFSSAGFSLQYAGIGVGAEGANADQSVTQRIQSSDFCQSSEEEFASEYVSQFWRQDASGALGAWLQCMQSQNVTALNYSVEDDGSAFTGEIFVTANQGIIERTITGVQITGPAKDSVTCQINGQILDIPTLPDEPFKLPSTRSVVSCEKTDGGLALVTLVANVDPLTPPIRMEPQDTQQDQIQALEQGLADLRSEIEAVQNDSASFKSDINRQIADVNAKVGGISVTAVPMEFPFSNNPTPSVIPGSQGAAFCALTHVDDDHPDASCSVSTQGGEWLVQTGLNGNFNACRVACVFIQMSN